MATKPASSAFPQSEEQTLGLTKREYFAAMALQGLLAGRMADSEVSAQEWSEWAVEYANELINALNSTAQKPEGTFKLEPLEPAPWDEAVESEDGFHG